jgi:hypothetical protein
VGILEGELNLKSTTHEHNLYRDEIDGEMVLVCRIDDSFAFASASRETTEKLIAAINARVQLLGVKVLTPGTTELICFRLEITSRYFAKPTSIMFFIVMVGRNLLFVNRIFSIPFPQ